MEKYVLAGHRLATLLICTIALHGCVAYPLHPSRPASPLALGLTQLSPDQVEITYTMTKASAALHFVQELGGYRAAAWRPTDSGFRWVNEGTGERVERSDGKPFERVTFQIPIDYRALPKSYAPFSPFSEGSALVHSGQFHACPSLPCDGTGKLPISIRADGKIVGVGGQRSNSRARFVSDGEGTNIFLGTLKPVAADGFVAIIDPGLPEDLRRHLDLSLPQSMRFFGSIYDPLSFTPELYVSIDARPESGGRESSQGGTLPNQIFMHFDGAKARERLASGTPYWLDWFFAHEAAHLFQQDKIGRPAGDDNAAWLHEGGADAMAALALAARTDAESSYARQRANTAEATCAKGLAIAPLDRATASGNFDLHYQCGLLIWLALDQALRAADRDGLNELNRAFFDKVRSGQPWNEAVFLATAKELGTPDALLARIERLSRGGYRDASAEVAALGALAQQSLSYRDSR